MNYTKLLKYSVALSLLFAVCACDDDAIESVPSEPDTPVITSISGVDEVEFGSTSVKFSVVKRQGHTYAWTVNNATVTTPPETEGRLKYEITLDVDKVSSGSISLSVVETNSKGVSSKEVTKEVKILNGKPIVKIQMKDGVYLKQGSSDTVLFISNSELKTVPVVSVTSGSISPLKLITGSKTQYMAIFTAGAEKSSKLSASNGVETDANGGMTMDKVDFNLPIDNENPYVTTSFDKYVVKDSSEFVIMATFNEEISQKTIVYVESTSTPGNALVKDTMVRVDATHYTYKTFHSGGGDGAMKFLVTGATDIAGNLMSSTIINPKDLVIDNTSDVPTLTTEVEYDFRFVQEMSTVELANGKIQYAVLSKDSTVLSTDDLSKLDGTVAEGVVDVAATGVYSFDLDIQTGDYKIHVVGFDEAGNKSNIVSSAEFKIK